MTRNISPTAQAMTAIAAALALTSTASFAQDAAPAPDTPVETPAASDPLAPEPAAEEPSTTTEAAAPPAPKPKVEARTTAARSTKPARASARASAPAPRPAARQASAAAPPPAPVATPAPAPVETAAAAPLPAEPLPTAVEPAPPPAAEPAPAGGTAGALIAEIMADDRLPYAGGAALGLLALGGAGLVSRRRKRRRENEAFETRQQFLDQAEGEAEPPVLELGRSAELRPGPAFARPAPIHDPVPAQKAAAGGAQATKLPEGFDLSRFGRHVQAAYRGPTADNPSLSLKYRLRRGAALDQQERLAAEQAGSRPAATPAANIPASIPARGNWESRPDADYLFRRAAKPAEPAKPAEREVEHH